MTRTQLKPPGYHTLRDGETLAGLAQAYGLPSEAPIWADPRNANVRRERKGAKNVRAGDIVYVPSTRPTSEARAPRTEANRATDQTHVFQAAAGPGVVRLCRLVLPTNWRSVGASAGASEGASDDGKEKSELDRLTAALSAIPCANARGILLPPRSPSAEKMQFFRTDRFGAIRVIDESRIEDFSGASRQPPPVRLESGAEFLLYACASAERVKRAISALRTDFSGAMARLRFTKLAVTPAGTGAFETDPFGLKKPQLAHLLNDEVFTRGATSMWRSGDQILKALPRSPVEANARYVFARCEAMSAVIAAHLIGARAVSIVEGTAPEYGIFGFARMLHDAAAARTRVPALERGWQGEYVDRWVRYAYAASENAEIDPSLFHDAVWIRVASWGWVSSANDVADLQARHAAGKAAPPHPMAHPRTGRVTAPACYRYYQYYGGTAGMKGTYAYFALGRFAPRAASAIGNDWYMQTETALDEVRVSAEGVSGLIRQLLAERASPAAMVNALLDWHEDLEATLADFRGYLELATAVDLRWWEIAEPAAWIAPILTAYAASGIEKLSSLFKEYFGDWEHVQAVQRMLGTGEKVEKFRVAIGGLSKKLGRQPNRKAARSIGDSKITADFLNRKLTLEVQGDLPLKATLDFEIVEEMAPTVRTHQQRVRGRLTKLRRVTGPPRVQPVIRPVLPELHQWPYLAIPVGQAIQLQRTWEDFRAKHLTADQRAFLAVRLMAGGGQLASSAAALAGLLVHRRNPLRPAGKNVLWRIDKFVGGGAVLLEIGANAYEGAVLLLSPSSDLQRAWAAGEVVDGTLYTVKAMALATGAPALLVGVSQVIGGASIVSTIGWLNWYATAVGFVVLAADIGIVLARDPHSIIDDVLDQLEKAADAELDRGRDGSSPRTARELKELRRRLETLLQ